MILSPWSQASTGKKVAQVSKPQIRQALARLLNDHAPWIDTHDGIDHVECYCGDSFPYMSLWSIHTADAIVDNILGGSI